MIAQRIFLLALSLMIGLTFTPIETRAADTLETFKSPDISCHLAFTNDCKDVQPLLNAIIAFMISIAGTLFMIMLLVGGMQYLTGAGNSEVTGKAKETMLAAGVGLIIVLSAWAILTFVLNQLQ